MKESSWMRLVLVGAMATCVLVAVLLLGALAAVREAQEERAEQLREVLARLDAAEAREEGLLDELEESLQAQQERLDEVLDDIERLREETALPQWDVPLSAELQQHLVARCRAAGVPPALLLAVMEHESGFQPQAVNHNSNGTVDVGLCQINSANWQWLAQRGIDVHTPQGNIDAAVLMLARLRAQGYDTRQTLAAYAAGEAGMRRGQGYWFPEEILARAPQWSA